MKRCHAPPSAAERSNCSTLCPINRVRCLGVSQSCNEGGIIRSVARYRFRRDRFLGRDNRIGCRIGTLDQLQDDKSSRS